MLRLTISRFAVSRAAHRRSAISSVAVLSADGCRHSRRARRLVLLSLLDSVPTGLVEKMVNGVYEIEPAVVSRVIQILEAK